MIFIDSLNVLFGSTVLIRNKLLIRDVISSGYNNSMVPGFLTRSFKVTLV